MAERWAGRIEGQQIGQQEKVAELDAVITRLNQVILKLHDPIQGVEDQVEEALLNVVFALSRSVIKRELQMDSRQIAGVVREVLQSLPSAHREVRIKFNPVDLEWVKKSVETLKIDVDLVPVEQLLPGGCEVETSHSLIDYTVEKRFQRTVQKMLSKSLASDMPEERADLVEVMDEMADFHRDVLEEANEQDAPQDASEHCGQSNTQSASHRDSSSDLSGNENESV